jgi:DNA polymerase III subunit epsilon
MLVESFQPDECSRLSFYEEPALLEDYSNHFLVVDTETTGVSKIDQVIEIGWILLQDCQRVESNSELWRSDQPINPFAQQVHNISEMALNENGKDPKERCKAFLEFAKKVVNGGGKLVAHNAVFDLRMINQTAEHNGIAGRLSSDDFLCTMKHSKPHVQVKNAKGHVKNPSKEELYRFQFNEDPSVPNHRALDDASVTCASFIQGKIDQWW